MRSTSSGCPEPLKSHWPPIAWPPAASTSRSCAWGAVIRGETTHDQHINRAVSLGLMEAGLKSGVPVLFGVLTCESIEQAIHRAGGNVGNKGVECAEAALRMVNLMDQLP